MMDDITISNHLERLKESFLWAAAKGGRVQECSSLLALGADVNWVQRDDDSDNNINDHPPSSSSSSGNDDTPLLVATRNGHYDVATVLLAHGANPSARDGMGNTVLHLAANRGDDDFCLELLRNGMMSSGGGDECILAMNDDGLTAIDVAMAKGFYTLAQRLKDVVGGSVSEEDGDGYDSDDGDEDDERRQLSEMEEFIRRNSRGETDVRASDSSEDDDDDDSVGWRYDSRGNVMYGGDSDEEKVESFTNVMNNNNNNINSLSPSNENHETTYYTYSDFETDMMNDHNNNPNNNNNNSNNNMISSASPAHHPNSLRDDNNSSSLSPQSTCARLAMDLMTSESRCAALRNELHSLRTQMNNNNLLLYPDSSSSSSSSSSHPLETQSIAHLEDVERRLRTALKRVVEEKETAIKKLLTDEEKKHVCVVCQENEKCVLLMPCRHLCVCKGCSRREELGNCPLCRVEITQKIDVYS